ncbi:MULTISPECIES: YqaA family protein [Luteimonas]|uniref:YqaA family protein n=1 Tax=Luteimonas TaxID=83614 RepID=UPI000C7A2519|nr:MULTISPECIES: VTT domain-containing protein [Luteimonas]
MRLFGSLYARCLQWARHPHAPWYLTTLSAAESVVFPIPPDVMLAPMALARPRSWWRYALLCTLGSVAGGLLGYLLGHYALDLVWPWIVQMGWEATFARVQALFLHHGMLFVFLAAFTPIPYKVFTIASGSLGVGLLPFLAGSLFGRGARFFLVAGLMAWGGPRVEPVLRRYIEWLGWWMVALVVVGLIWMEWRR